MQVLPIRRMTNFLNSEAQKGSIISQSNTSKNWDSGVFNRSTIVLTALGVGERGISDSTR